MKYLITSILILWVFIAWTLLRLSSLCSREEERELGILIQGTDEKKE